MTHYQLLGKILKDVREDMSDDELTELLLENKISVSETFSECFQKSLKIAEERPMFLGRSCIPLCSLQIFLDLRRCKGNIHADRDKNIDTVCYRFKLVKKCLKLFYIV